MVEAKIKIYFAKPSGLAWNPHALSPTSMMISFIQLLSSTLKEWKCWTKACNNILCLIDSTKTDSTFKLTQYKEI